MNYHQSLMNHETHESFSTMKLTKGHESTLMIRLSQVEGDNKLNLND